MQQFFNHYTYHLSLIVMFLTINIFSTAQENNQLQGEKTINNRERGNADFTFSPAGMVDDKKGGQFYETIDDMRAISRQGAQLFWINTERDTVLRGRDGSRILIPAHAFKGLIDNRPTKGKVKITLREFYELSDFILAGLTTTSGDGILESAGSIEVRAFKGSNELTLASSKNIEIGFPADELKADMQLFSGQRKSGIMEWLPTNGKEEGKAAEVKSFLSSTSEKVFSIVEEMPMFPGGDEALQRYLADQLVYPEGYQNRAEQSVFIHFDVEVSGQISNVQIIRRLSPNLDKIAFRMVREMPDWEPGRQRGKKVRVRYSLPVTFGRKNTLKNSERITQSALDTIQVQYEKGQDPPSPKNFRMAQMTSIDKNKYARKFKRRTSSENIKNRSKADVARYVFTSAKLGWINCDRFIGNTNPKRQLVLNLEKPECKDVYAVFKNQKAILPGYLEDGQWKLIGIPEKTELKIVVLDDSTGSVRLAMNDYRVSKEKYLADFEYNKIYACPLPSPPPT